MGQTIHFLIAFIWKEAIDIDFNQIWPTLKFDPRTLGHFDFMQITHTVLPQVDFFKVLVNDASY